MEQLISNKDLERENTTNDIKSFLKNFENIKGDVSEKRGLYIHGSPGCGKTTFVTNILTEFGYDIIKFDAGDVRNKTIIERMAKNNMAENNVASLFMKKKQPIAIVMDEIDGMNNGDKGGINALIKLIRPKKTKKQKLEEIINTPIICISNNHKDKKIKELMKVCYTYEIKSLESSKMLHIISKTMPDIEIDLKKNICLFVQGDLRKLQEIYKIYKNQPSVMNNEVIKKIMNPKSYSDDTKEITTKLLTNQYPISEHLQLINDTDRTIVGLLLHENIIDVLETVEKKISFPIYQKIIDNICFADYIDRLTFQKQIWQFNEMSSLIKTFNSSRILHENFNKKKGVKLEDIRFTKVLTKYSTEYNNSIFINKLCQELSLDKKDMFYFFVNSRETLQKDDFTSLLQLYDINKLEINRIYRYLDKFGD